MPKKLILILLVVGFVLLYCSYIAHLKFSAGTQGEYQKTLSVDSHSATSTGSSTISSFDYTHEKLSIKKGDQEHIFDTTVAQTEQSREKGLGGITTLLKDEAMLFVFGYDNRWSFWMKDMKFPIDMIWLDVNKKVVDVAESVSPDTYPKSFTPQNVARYVLEVNAGIVNELGIKIGDQFK